MHFLLAGHAMHMTYQPTRVAPTMIVLHTCKLSSAQNMRVKHRQPLHADNVGFKQALTETGATL